MTRAISFVVGFLASRGYAAESSRLGLRVLRSSQLFDVGTMLAAYMASRNRLEYLGDCHMVE
jgi:hypothetical protein